MIIYGTKAKPLKSLHLAKDVCANCSSKGTIVMSIFSKYVHIFWLPTFPIGRTCVSTCTHCQQTLVHKEMPAFLKLQYDQAVAQTKVPLWTWSGLAIIVVLASAMVYNVSLHEKNEKLYINAPAVGDIYQFKTETGAYSLMKVVDVMSDSLLVQMNAFEVDKMSGVYSLKEKPFEEEAYILSKADVLEMYNSERIYGVERE